jgi:predicted HicB family RNase H-like nuclease
MTDDQRHKPGRPSLSSTGGDSPVVAFRVPRRVEAAAKARAEQEGVSLSRLAREALEQRLAEAS